MGDGSHGNWRISVSIFLMSVHAQILPQGAEKQLKLMWVVVGLPMITETVQPTTPSFLVFLDLSFYLFLESSASDLVNSNEITHHKT